MLTKEKVIRGCLIWETGIIYRPADNASTTTEEIKEAKEQSRHIRYVDSDTITKFMNTKNPDQLEYALDNGLSLLDFSTWQATQEVLLQNTDINEKISYDTSKKIVSALREIIDAASIDPVR